MDFTLVWILQSCFNLYSDKLSWLTYSILEVLMSDQFEVLFYGFGGQSVLSEDKVFSVNESVYLAHRHVWQEVLEKRRTKLLLFITNNVYSRNKKRTGHKDWKSFGLDQFHIFSHTDKSNRSVPTLAFPVLCSICTNAQATSSLLLTLSTGSSTAHMVR